MDELFNQKQLRYDAIKISMYFGQDRTRVSINPLFSDFKGNFDSIYTASSYSSFYTPRRFLIYTGNIKGLRQKRILTVHLDVDSSTQKLVCIATYRLESFRILKRIINVIQSNLPKGVDYFVFCVLHLAVRITTTILL